MNQRSPLQITVRSLTFICLLLLIAHCSLLSAWAQSNTAKLSGTVTDTNGGVVPGVDVKVTDPATGLKRTATTNESGQFVVPLLPASTYSVLLQHGGFMTAEVNNVVLNVNDDKSLKIQLKAGDIKETVNVTGDTPLINESPAVATVVDLGSSTPRPGSRIRHRGRGPRGVGERRQTVSWIKRGASECSRCRISTSTQRVTHPRRLQWAPRKA